MARKLSWSWKLSGKHPYIGWAEIDGLLVTAYADKKPTKEEIVKHAEEVMADRNKLRKVM
jgi:hypothetical protein